MGFESTITEHDLAAATGQFTEKNRESALNIEPDLDIDGLSDSIGARVKRFLSFGRA